MPSDNLLTSSLPNVDILYEEVDLDRCNNPRLLSWPGGDKNRIKGN